MINKMWSVSSLVNYIKVGIDHDQNLMQLFVQGEISNLVKHRSGHYYFTLKDDKSRMSCVMFATHARLLRFNLQDGNKVIVQCRVSMYEASGSVQLYVNGIQLDGIGDLYYQFELLKKKLLSEGYFEQAHKKQIPEYPMDIALISAKEAAAMHDVMTTIKRRWPIAHVTLYPSLVQGNGASAQLIEVLKEVDQKHHDVILLVRGGGSIEDLWAFNSEALAKTIYHLNTPIVSGVGHESDTTLVDYVSDARAATPTAAAELVTPDIQEVKQALNFKRNEICQKMNHKIKQASYELDLKKNHAYIKNPMSFIENNMITLDLKRNLFEKEIVKLTNVQNEILNKQNKLQMTMNNKMNNYQFVVSNKKNQLIQMSKLTYQQYENEHKKHIELLDAYSPLKVLLRGYSITMKDEQVLRHVDDVNVNDEIKTRVSDGVIVSKVVSKEKNYG